MELYWSGYEYPGPGAKLEEWLKKGDLGINELNKIAKQHAIDYSHYKKLARQMESRLKNDKAVIK